MGKTSTSAALASLLCAACGRLSFEPAADAARPADARVFSRFCEGAVGTFCWPSAGSGYIDNIMFWGR